MSSSESATDETSAFESTLHDARAALRRSDLRSRLDDLTTTLRECILLSDILASLTGSDHSIDAEVREEIRAMCSHIEERDFEAIENDLSGLESSLSSEHRRIERAIEQQVIAISETLDAMAKLNDRIENVDPERISMLQNSFDSLTELGFVSGDSLPPDRETVGQRVADLQTEYSSVQEAVFGQFYGTDLEEVIRRLLDDEDFRIEDLSTDQFERLQDSELADCLELKLS